MFPTDDEITPLGIVSVLLEVETGKLVLDQAIDEVVTLALLEATSLAIGEL
jgi:hypothetical protein